MRLYTSLKVFISIKFYHLIENFSFLFPIHIVLHYFVKNLCFDILLYMGSILPPPPPFFSSLSQFTYLKRSHLCSNSRLRGHQFLRDQSLVIFWKLKKRKVEMIRRLRSDRKRREQFIPDSGKSTGLVHMCSRVIVTGHYVYLYAHCLV